MRRSELGLSQANLAKSINMDQAQYSRIERGIIDPGVGTLARIAHALRTDLATLVTGVSWLPD